MIEKEYQEVIKSLSGKPSGDGEVKYESFKAIKDICRISNPTTILELGFNRGASAFMWLESSKAKLHSIDRLLPTHVEKSINYFNLKYPGRFQYTHYDHQNLTDLSLELTNQYDLIFIDGEHTQNGIYRDTKNSISLNPKFIVFDDYLHKSHEMDIFWVIKDFKLEIIREYNTSNGHVLTYNPLYTPK
tara:strand:+ start:485 stop:1048 length:564 start_codon:yes stop_codon:yes gene_type:complete